MTEEEAALHAAQQVGHLYTFLTIVAIAGIALIVMAFFGSLTARQAIKRGHLPRTWFWIGFTLPVIGLIALFVAKPGPAAQMHREHWFRALFRRERVWDEGDARGAPRRRVLLDAGLIAVAGLAGLIIGGTSVGWGWGIFWGIVGIGVGAVVLMGVSIVTDRLPQPEPGYTPSEDRPPEPRRVVTLVFPLVLMVVAFWFGGVFGDVLWGVLWGVIGAAGVIAARNAGSISPN